MDTNPSQPLQQKVSTGGFVSAVLTWIAANTLTALSALPPENQQQLAALGGTFFGFMLRPIAKELVDDLFSKKVTVEDAKPSVTDDVQRNIDISIADADRV